MYWYAKSMRPPLQPWSFSLSQSTSCCSDRLVSLPVLMALMPSTAPTALKAQQEPHICWFFTPVTAPALRQSTAAGRSPTLTPA